MKEKLAQIKAEAIKQIENSRTLEQLNEVRVSQLGKKGAFNRDPEGYEGCGTGRQTKGRTACQ